MSRGKWVRVRLIEGYRAGKRVTSLEKFHEERDVEYLSFFIDLCLL